LAIHFPISILSLSNGDVDDVGDDDSTVILTYMKQVVQNLSALVSAVLKGILSYLLSKYYYCCWTSLLLLYRLNFVDRMKSLVVVVVDFVDKRYYWNLLS
jgi:hypothetical protein